MKDQYETICSIHIYSLSPYRLQDLQALTEIGRDLFNSVFAKEDPLLHNKTYGVIQNSGVRRRTGRRPPISEAPIAKFRPVKDDTKEPTETAATRKTSNPPATLKKEDSSRPSSAGSSTTASSIKQPTLKRDTSDIFKSFAKAKSKPKDENKNVDASTNGDSPAQSGPEDTKMTDADEEGESEDEALFLDTKTRRPAKKRSSEGNVTKDKQERAAKLKKMMDSDEESEPVSAKTEENKEEADKTEAEDADVAWSESDSEQVKAAKQDGNSAEKQQTTTSAEPMRRRGRRKVMKKRTMKDEEGYLVTKEEAVWESFSEDEPASQPKSKTAKIQSQHKSSAGSARAGVKAAGKGGNIMSFFGKK